MTIKPFKVSQDLCATYANATEIDRAAMFSKLLAERDSLACRSAIAETALRKLIVNCTVDGLDPDWLYNDITKRTFETHKDVIVEFAESMVSKEGNIAKLFTKPS